MKTLFVSIALGLVVSTAIAAPIGGFKPSFTPRPSYTPSPPKPSYTPKPTQPVTPTKPVPSPVPNTTPKPTQPIPTAKPSGDLSNWAPLMGLFGGYFLGSLLQSPAHAEQAASAASK